MEQAHHLTGEGAETSAGTDTAAASGPASVAIGAGNLERIFTKTAPRSTTAMSATAATATAAAAEGEEETFVFPRAPLPEIILSNTPGSWAYDTMVRERARDRGNNGERDRDGG